jgi:hypothetical protein
MSNRIRRQFDKLCKRVFEAQKLLDEAFIKKPDPKRDAIVLTGAYESMTRRGIELKL